MHRLAFISQEFAAIKRIRDTDLALQRLVYHMENYLIRVYELRERTVNLFAIFAGYKGKIHLLKRKRTRQKAVRKLTAVDQSISDTYIEILSIIDDDINLRNQNTHDTFISLGLATEDNIYDPHDALLDVQHQHPKMYDDYRKRIREEIGKTVQRYNQKIARINRLTMKALDQMDFTNRGEFKRVTVQFS